jgi:hypothetical protein
VDDEHSMDHPFVQNDDWRTEDSDDLPKRRRWLTVLVSVVIVVVAIGTALYVAASHYQPLEQKLDGGYGTQIETINGTLAANRIVGAAGSSHMVWTEPSGSFLVEVVFTINNLQRFPVTIEKVTPPSIPSGTSNVHVYFDTKSNGTGTYGLKGGPAFTPTTLASGGQLELAIHWDQQCVPTSAQSATSTYTALPVEYSFMSFHHTVTVPIHSLYIAPRATC